jgi:hypothetical protein
MRFLLALLGIFLAFVVGIFVEHDFSVVNLSKGGVAVLAKKAGCDCNCAGDANKCTCDGTCCPCEKCGNCVACQKTCSCEGNCDCCSACLSGGKCHCKPNCSCCPDCPGHKK